MWWRAPCGAIEIAFVFTPMDKREDASLKGLYQAMRPVGDMISIVGEAMRACSQKSERDLGVYARSLAHLE
jgi:hypothetical protein